MNVVFTNFAFNSVPDKLKTANLGSEESDSRSEGNTNGLLAEEFKEKLIAALALPKGVKEELRKM